MTPQPHPLPPPAAQQPIGELLGLGRHWQPGAAGWDWQAVNGPTGKLYVLRVFTQGGTTGIALTEQDVRRLIDTAERALSPIVVPDAVVPGHGNGQVLGG